MKVSDSLDNVPNEKVVTQLVNDRPTNQLTDQLLELLEWVFATKNEIKKKQKIRRILYSGSLYVSGISVLYAVFQILFSNQNKNMYYVLCYCYNSRSIISKLSSLCNYNYNVVQPMKRLRMSYIFFVLGDT